MRERIALGICALTLCVLVGLSYAFAARKTGPEPTAARDSGENQEASASVVQPEAGTGVEAPEALEQKEEERGVTEANLKRGREVYEEQRCSTCHSIAGNGNPRNKLDGVGGRWEAGEIRDWITGDGLAKDILSESVIKRKQRYTSIPGPDLNALILYLSTLKTGPQ